MERKDLVEEWKLKESQRILDKTSNNRIVYYKDTKK